MDDAMKKVESLGGKVTYNAPLMSMKDVMEKYKTVGMAKISRECPDAAATHTAVC